MFSLNCKGRLFVIDAPIVMGILNATPDSFFEGSRMQHIDQLLFKAEQMLKDGAAIIDVGGQSTRPDSTRITADEEAQRVIPFVEALSKRFPDLVLSIDTFYSKVAKEAIHAGASIVNDVSAGTIDEAMFEAVASLKVPYVLMHMKGDLQTMQAHARYENVTLEVFDFINTKIRLLQNIGVSDIIVDPGFGFAKNSDHNFQLLNNLSFFQELERPLLIGLSRKATIYKTLGITATEALNGTTVLNTISLLKGANILRVHDVKEAFQAIQLFRALEKS